MSEWWAEMACAVGIGLLLGRLWAGWAIWGYIQSKAPSAVGWRTQCAQVREAWVNQQTVAA